jgi:hypothetical protein
MHPITNFAKRLVVAGSLLVLAACGSNGITDPTAKNSGYLTVSASVVSAPLSTTTTTSGTAPISGSRVPGKQTTVQSGYNVPAN